MKAQEYYKNGQPTSEQEGDTLTYFFKTGIVKAQGKSVDGMMQGEWIFNRESGQLWQVGHFQDDKKHGLWLRYDKEGNEEYRATFTNGKQDKSPPKDK